MIIIVYSFLATGDSFWTLHICFRRDVFAIAQAVYKVSESIWTVLHPIYMKPPTLDDWKQIEYRFSTRWNFPNCVGAIDDKHVMIKAPPNSSSLFHNYKAFFSIVLMALLDADYRFIYVDVGDFASNGDISIFRNCPLGKNFMDGNLDVPVPKKDTWLASRWSFAPLYSW